MANYATVLRKRDAINAANQAARQRVLAAMWRRFCREAAASGKYGVGELLHYPKTERETLVRLHTPGSRRALVFEFRLKTVLECQLLKIADDCFDSVLEGEPTDAQPGSMDKIEVMANRVAKGQPIFHPGDVTAIIEPGELPGERQSPLRGVAMPISADDRIFCENYDLGAGRSWE